MMARKLSFEVSNRSLVVGTAGLIGVMIAFCLLLLTGDRLSRSLFDSWQRWSPRELTQSEVRIVLIDSESLVQIGRWPWPRYHIARLTEEIAAQKPAAIGFDMIFPETDPIDPALFTDFYPELSASSRQEISALQNMDDLFGQVIGSSPSILGRIGVSEGGSKAETLLSTSVTANGLPEKITHFPTALNNIPPLENRALGYGLLNAQPDDDGTIRRIPLIMKIGERPMPGIALEIARAGSGVEGITVQKNAISLDDQVIPVDAHGRMILHFGKIPPEHIVSAAELFKQNFGTDVLSGKIVLIGLAAEGTTDIVLTPLAAENFGVFVQAQAIDAIVRAGWLSRPSWAPVAEWGAAILLISLALGAVIRRGWFWPSLSVLAGLSISMGFWFAFKDAGILLDPLRPLILGGGGVSGSFFGVFLHSHKERQRLKEILFQQQIETAAAEGELQAARSIQLSMLPDADHIRNIDTRVDIGARLEAAKSVGGDFFDVMKLNDDLIALVIADVTGKGVPAALFMALSKAITKSLLPRGDLDLSDTVTALNREISDGGNDQMGLTMLLAILDLRTGEMKMVNAGHENPIIVSQTGSVRNHMMEGGPPFCVMDFPYPVERLTLSPGDTLVMITDGVTEAQNEQGVMFGLAGTHTAVAGFGDSSASALVDACCTAVRRHEAGTDASDDLTILVVRYKGP